MSEYFRFIFFISNKIRIFFSFIFISNIFFCAYKCSINFLYFSYYYYYLFIRWNFQILRGRMENVRINQNLISFNEIFMAGLCLNCDCVVGDWLLFPLNPLEMLLINFITPYISVITLLCPRGKSNVLEWKVNVLWCWAFRIGTRDNLKSVPWCLKKHQTLITITLESVGWSPMVKLIIIFTRNTEK